MCAVCVSVIESTCGRVRVCMNASVFESSASVIEASAKVFKLSASVFT